jgi:hypothetical protein
LIGLIRKTRLRPPYVCNWHVGAMICRIRAQADTQIVTPGTHCRPEGTADKAPIHDERVAVHKGRFLAGQPQRRVGDIQWQARSRDRLDLSKSLFQDFNGLVCHLRCQADRLAKDRCRDSARTDAIDPDVALTKFLGN